MIEEFEQILKTNQYINIIEMSGNTSYKGSDYECIASCELKVDGDIVNIMIALPFDWEIRLIDFYITDRDFPFIPHVDTKGKLCLFDLEGCLIDGDLKGVIFQSINRTIEIISAGVKGLNKEDFIKEYELYWMQLDNIKRAKVIYPLEKKVNLLKYIGADTQRKKGESSIKYRDRLKKTEMLVFQSTVQLDCYKNRNGTQKNCIYYPIFADKNILPPDPRLPLQVDYINMILSKGSVKDLKVLFKKLGREKIIFFEIKQPNGIYNCFGIGIKDGIWIEEKLVSYSELYPIYVTRIDKKFLMGRVDNNDMQNKKILLIGCGSIGGYIADSLSKAGIENIMLVDDDMLKEENIFRHLLGMQYVSMYKCVALAEYLKRNIPDIKVQTHVKDIQSAVKDEEIDLNEYDIIISAVGNHNVNLWLNRYVIKNEINVPIIYAWNEVYGIGNHVAYIDRSKYGCYQCFFARDDETDELYDRNSYCLQGQVVVSADASCGTSYIPYGATVSQKTALMCVELLSKVFRGDLEENIIISSKGDKDYFESRGLEVSNKYVKQENNVIKFEGKKFKNEKCVICRGECGNRRN